MLRPRGRAERSIGALGVGAAQVALWLAVLLLIGPIALVAWLSFGADPYTVVPPNGYSFKWYLNIVERDEFIPAFWTSIQIAFLTMPAAVVIGTLAAFALDRYRLPGGAALQILLYSPISIPLVVSGIALLYFYARLEFLNNFWNIVLAHIIITFPYVIRAVSVSLARYDRSLDEAAASLGARPAEVFWRITLPMVRPGIFAGALFAFVLSFEDFTVTIFLIGTDTHTLPVAIYQYMEWNVDPTVSAVTVVLVLIAVGLMLVVDRVIGLDRFIGVRG